jgi:hypothetical protein
MRRCTASAKALRSCVTLLAFPETIGTKGSSPGSPSLQQVRFLLEADRAWRSPLGKLAGQRLWTGRYLDRSLCPGCGDAYDEFHLIDDCRHGSLTSPPYSSLLAFSLSIGIERDVFRSSPRGPAAIGFCGFSSGAGWLMETGSEPGKLSLSASSRFSSILRFSADDCDLLGSGMRTPDRRERAMITFAFPSPWS